MLTKKRRLTTKLFSSLGGGCKTKRTSHFVLKNYKMSDVSDPRFAVVVSKTVSKSAVVRNKIKRRVYSCIADNGVLSSGNGVYVIYCQKGCDGISFDKLKTQINTLFAI